MESPNLAYRPDASPAFALRWSWTGWPSMGDFPRLSDDAFISLEQLWESDGIRVLERKFSADTWSLVVSTKPSVSPMTMVGRLKGRMDHYFRSCKIPFKFSRKVSLRSIGNNTVDDVQNYIAKQVDAAQFIDARCSDELKLFTRVWNDKQFSEPLEVSSGRYWYQLHLVLVVESRHRIRDIDFLGRVFEVAQAIAMDRGYVLGAISVMPDHLHLSLRGAVVDSPESIALHFQNETTSQLKASGLWMPSYYVGTIGAYNMHAVRNKLS